MSAKARRPWAPTATSICSATIVGAAVALLVGPLDEDARIGALLLAAAATTKQEGLIAALVVALLAIVRARSRRVAGLVSLSFVPAVLWIGVVTRFGVPSETDRQRLQELLHLERVVTDRFDPTLSALWDEMWPLLLSALVVTIVGMVVFRRDARPSAQSRGGLLWIVWGATSLALLVAYLVSPLPIGFHLVSSIDRTTITPKLTLVLIVAVWTIVGVRAIADQISVATDTPEPRLGARTSEARLSSGEARAGSSP